MEYIIKSRDFIYPKMKLNIFLVKEKKRILLFLVNIIISNSIRIKARLFINKCQLIIKKSKRVPSCYEFNMVNQDSENNYHTNRIVNNLAQQSLL